MPVKITNPGASNAVGDPNLAHGSFEFYLTGTNVRARPSKNRNMTELGRFQNSFNAKSQPIEHLWMENLTGFDICLRNNSGVQISRTPLSESIGVINCLSSLSTRVDNATGTYPYMQPLQDKRGGTWVLNGLYWGPTS